MLHLMVEFSSFYSNFVNQIQIKLINHVSQQYTVDAPKDFLRVIFSNFIDNSIKHASATKVVVKGGVNEDGILYVRFEDDGLGLDEKSIALFNNYYKES